MLLIVVYDSRRRAPDSDGDLLGIMSLGCVMQTIWLMAEALGIGVQVLSAFSGRWAESDLRAILNIPVEMKLASPAGSAIRTPRPRDICACGGWSRTLSTATDIMHPNEYLSRYPWIAKQNPSGLFNGMGVDAPLSTPQ